ncbi:Disease resistance protein [Artemisia annua]|uniref:Disease resistance protein n=1 Tax=Artemisia annua TaxID=35608 RepID=A0A2U1NXD2_ARTAN|nr:Disease resistance protein [Artemisia annua]
MADPITSALVNEVVGRLASAAIQEYGLLRGLKNDLSALGETFQQIQGVLRDAEKKQTTQEGVKEWLKTLKSASLEGENVLDEAKTEAMIQMLHGEMGKKYKIRAFFSSRYNSLMVKTRIAHKVKNIRKKLEDIDANKSKFQLITSEDGAGNAGEISNRETSSLMSKIYGRDEDKKVIVDTICSQDMSITVDDDDVRVYAIWGMGGIGKTTLAQYIYNHEKVKTHFELKCWVYVSNVFDVKRIVKQIIKAICGLEDLKLDEMSLDDLQIQLQNKLIGKKYFIVMDDVWIENNEKWNELCKPLSYAGKGSTVMVTTRKKNTAQLMARIPELQRNVEKLSEEESYELFKMFAFLDRGERENVSSELELVGKKIVDKCNGLPLAVITVGSLMLTKEKKVNEWQDVNDNFNWEQDDDIVLPALRLSYNDLPPRMKLCFAYCCVFSKGEEMSKNSLIELWTANGFIPSEGGMSSYVLGEKIFTFLAQRSFFQDVFEKDIDTGAICKMHDLMHDLALDVMKHDCAVIEPGKESITPDEVLHLSLSCEDFEFSKQDLRKLRSVLILEQCWGFRELPKGLRYMRNLQRLDTRDCPRLRHMPIGIKELTILRRLSKFVVGKDDGARIGELGNLNLLGWSLWLSGLENVEGLRDAKSANLKDKTNLKSLKLDWSWDTDRSETFDSEVLEGLEPHSGLQELTIFSYTGTVLSPSWLVKLVHLTSIKFVCLEKCEHMPPLGILPSLKRIRLSSMHSLKCFHDDDNATSKDKILFPSLQHLVIVSCCDLVSLPSNFPKLRYLGIEFCDKLCSLPDEIQSFKDFNEIRIEYCEILSRRCEKEIGEDWPKISHIPHLDIEPPRSEDKDSDDDSVNFRDEDSDENEKKDDDSVNYRDEDSEGNEKKDNDSVNYRDEDSDENEDKDDDSYWTVLMCYLGQLWDCVILDHCPIFLSNASVNFEPKPFRVFDSRSVRSVTNEIESHGKHLLNIIDWSILALLRGTKTLTILMLLQMVFGLQIHLSSYVSCSKAQGPDALNFTFVKKFGTKLFFGGKFESGPVAQSGGFFLT